MFVTFHVNAYFSLAGEVLLYFIVWVEVVEILNLIWIQIGLKFINDLEKERGFSIFPSRLGQNQVSPPGQPSPPSLLFSNA
jgi:hypothetical protein